MNTRTEPIVYGQLRRRRLSLLLAALPLLALLSAPARAGQITLAVEATTTVKGRTLGVILNLTNRGTDAAGDVAVTASFKGLTQKLPVAEALAPEESCTAKMEFPLAEGLRGTFPLYAKIHYQDPAGRTFSTVARAIARTPDAPAAGLNMSVTRGYGKEWGRVRVDLASQDAAVATAAVTCHCPDDLQADPATRTVKFEDGKASAHFTLTNRTATAGSRYAVFFAAEYDRDGVHYLADAAASIPVEEEARRPTAPGGRVTDERRAWLQLSGWVWPVIAAAVVVLAGILACAWSWRTRGLLQSGFEEKRWPRVTLDLLALLAVETFIVLHLSPRYLLTETITTGGDTASHYYTLYYLRHVLLPSGRIGGWTPGNYAGFPILQFYFPLPFLLMCALDVVMPLMVAFKCVTLSGTFLLPVAAYLMLRSLRCPFPGPAIGSACVLPFLFNLANSMWGGNILSTLAGEFSYSLSLALSLILIGSLYRGCLSNRGVILNALLVFLVGFSHGYTLLFVEAMSVFLLITPHGFVRRVVYLGKVYALGFCLLAFWLVPLLAYSRYTTPYHTVWTIHWAREVVPRILLPMVVLAGAGSVALLVWGIVLFRHSGAQLLSVLAFLWFGLAAAGVMYVAAPKLGVVDIRYVPYAQLIACLLAAGALGWAGAALGRWGLAWAPLVLSVAAMLAWTSVNVDRSGGGAGRRVGVPASWAKWNYEGFEAKSSWPKFKSINDALRGTFEDPRVVFEHASAHNVFGSTRAFESLPLFAGRATLEGLYMQASISAPFVFYIQSEVSAEKSCPFPQYTYANMNFDRARRHLEMFNVRDLILRSHQARRAIRAADGYRLTQALGDYELWERTGGEQRYVVPLQHEPVFFATRGWKSVSHRWFTTDELLDRHLVFAPAASPEDRRRFKAQAASLDDLPRIPISTSDCRVTETIHDRDILIETNWINKPLLVKVSYHPNWRVEGADRVYLASPSFMLIYPNQEKVRLYYGSRLPEKLGMAFTFVGLIVLALNAPLSWKRKRTAWSLLSRRLGLPEGLEPHLKFDPPARVRWTILVLALGAGASALGIVCHRIYTREPHRLFNQSVKLKDAKRFEEARRGFGKVIETVPASAVARDSAYYVAICHYLEGEDAAAIRSFEELIQRYPDGDRVPEAHYHVGFCLFRSGDEEAAVARMRRLREEFPASPWAEHAADRLREHNALDVVGRVSDPAHHAPAD